jgi:L-histidine N-alpha-methyltransferase
LTTAIAANPTEAVLREAIAGLSATPQKALPPWLFYDQRGSELFEQITGLPEYYLTRTERAIFASHADEILLEFDAPVTIAELGAGSATKTGLILQAAIHFQTSVLYQPIDVSATALDAAAENLSASIQGLTIVPRVANYITEAYTLERPKDHSVLALYIGSSIGNFTPAQGTSIVQNLRAHLQPGDGLLLGTDLAPGEHKPLETILAAYDDAAGVTAAFNKNILRRLNRELDADFNLDCFAHRARWNPEASRIEMHLESMVAQTVQIPADGKTVRIHFEAGETIHTENSYKFTAEGIAALLADAGFAPTRTFHDPDRSFAVTLASAL